MPPEDHLANPISIHVSFHPSGRGKARCAPDPNYPDGIDLDMTNGEAIPSCLVKLPYPAPECGAWLIHCDLCGLSCAITAAGRPDDPKSARILCRQEEPDVLPS